MIYGSVCSGVEAATLAWEPLGWKAAWFSEIEPAPCKILAYRYPQIPNLGDMTKLKDNEQYRNTDINLLVGGTPCQSFSIAGLRGGMADDRGNLALEYCRILLDKQPRWFVWENVPGVFSSFTDESSSKNNFHSDLEPGDEYTRDITESSDFATLLSAFRECGYSVAYRVLDSRYFGVPQRRRRVFVVGHLGSDWRPPTAVLFERESLRRDFTPSKESGQEIAGTLEARTGGGGFPGSDGAMNGCCIPIGLDLSQRPEKLQMNENLSVTLTKGGTKPGHSAHIIMATGQASAEILLGQCPTLTKNHEAPILVHGTQDPCVSNNEAFTLGRNNGGENVLVQPYTLHGTDGTSSVASETETHTALRARTPGGIENSTTTIDLQTDAFMAGQGAKAGSIAYETECSPTLKSAASGTNQSPTIITGPLCFQQNPRDEVRLKDGDGNTAGAIQASPGMKQQNYLASPMVRRLTPKECERLQGFPDNYTKVPGVSETAQYACCGNSMTKNVMVWIGQRIDKVDKLIHHD